MANQGFSDEKQVQDLEQALKDLQNVKLESGKESETQKLKRLFLTFKTKYQKALKELTKREQSQGVSHLSKKYEEAKDLLKRYGIDLTKHTLIGINPGAAYGSAKCWLPDRFEGVTKRLLEDPNTYVVYFGDANGASLVNEICKNLPERVINLAAKTSIRELMAIIKLCSAFLTNDSGPMHIAAALDTPLLALFGSTNKVKTGPYPKGKMIHKHVECSPCYKRVCPIDFRCMERIEVDEVYEELIKVLEKSGQKRSL